MNVQVSASVPEDIKNEATYVVNQYGLELSDAIKMFTTIIAKEHRMPIQIDKKSVGDIANKVRSQSRKIPHLDKIPRVKLYKNERGVLTVPKGALQKWEMDAWEL